MWESSNRHRWLEEAPLNRNNVLERNAEGYLYLYIIAYIFKASLAPLSLQVVCLQEYTGPSHRGLRERPGHLLSILRWCQISCHERLTARLRAPPSSSSAACGAAFSPLCSCASRLRANLALTSLLLYLSRSFSPAVSYQPSRLSAPPYFPHY